MKEKSKIFFRADAGPQIGYGHFIRTLALADMLKEDFDCVLVTVNPTDYQINEMSKVCRFIPLQAENHFDSFLSILQGEEIVVLDNYFFTTDYQKAIKEKGCKLVCVDDLHDKYYVADVVIHQGNAFLSMFSSEAYTKFCIGYDWILLRRPFLEAFKNFKSRRIVEKIEKIAICFGGADMYNFTDKTVRLLQTMPNISQVDAIVGNYYQGDIPLDKFTKLKLYRNISAESIVDIFTHCDLAVVSTSTVCFEAMACHAMLAVGYYVDNQKVFYEYLTNNKMAKGLGNFLDNSFIDYLCTFINQYDNTEEILSLKLNLNDLRQRYINLFKEL